MEYVYSCVSGCSYPCNVFVWMDEASHFSVWLDGYLLNETRLDELFFCLVGWTRIAILIMSYGIHLSFIYLLSKHNHVRSYFVDLIKTNTMM